MVKVLVRCHIPFCFSGQNRTKHTVITYFQGGSCWWMLAEPRVLNWATENRKWGAKSWHRLVIIMSGIRSGQFCLFVGECVCAQRPLRTLPVAETSVANQWPDECCELWRQAGLNHGETLQSALLFFTLFIILLSASELNHTDLAILYFNMTVFPKGVTTSLLKL